MIAKYNSEGEIQWAKAIGESGMDCINSISATTEGGYIVGGSFESTEITLKSGIKLNNNGSSDGVIIKYTSEGEVQWANSIGEENKDAINDVVQIGDGGYIAGGYMDNVAVLVKYGNSGEIQWNRTIEETEVVSISNTIDRRMYSRRKL